MCCKRFFFCCVRDTIQEDVKEESEYDPLVIDGSSFWSRVSVSIQKRVSEWSLPQRKDTENRIKELDRYLAEESVINVYPS